MKILNVSVYCSDKVFEELMKSLIVKPENSVQKYYSLLIKGFLRNGASVTSLTQRQIRSSSTNKKWINAKYERVSDFEEFKYVPFCAIPGVGHILIFIYSFFYSLFFFLKNKNEKDLVVMCDIMRFWISTPVMLCSKIFGIHSIGYVADIPQMYNTHKSDYSSSLKSKILLKVYLYFDKMYSSYIFLSKYMNDKVNPLNKPHIIVEGIADGDDLIEQAIYESQKFIITYTGGLYTKFGIKNLLDAFSKIDDEDLELYICGAGELVSYIIELSKLDTRIKYYGVVNNSEAIRIQKMSSVLINPRPTDSDFTMYSFPSKTMEYMLSGSPVMSTRLKGIPDEYFDYLIPIDDSSVDGLITLINNVRTMPPHTLSDIGKKSRDFVIKYKNQDYQARRVLDWINNIISVSKVVKQHK